MGPLAMTTTDPKAEFAALSESEKRTVAERLLKIEQSGWRPFWCKNPQCTGDPHPLLDNNGDPLFMPAGSTAGPNGEPLGEPDEDGDLPVLDPAWAHNHARVDQRMPKWSEPWILAVLSGRGCVAPWTLIDLADGTRERIDVLAQRGESVEVMTPDGPAWTDGAPFAKGFSHQWRVLLSTGRVLTATDKHRFLAPGGWIPLTHVHAGQPLVAAGISQPLSDGQQSDADLSGWREDAQRCWRKELGSGCGCPKCRRQCDLPLPTGQGTAPANALLQAGAGERTQILPGGGGLGEWREDSPTCLQSAHQPRNGFAQVEPSLPAEGCQNQPLRVGRFLPSSSGLPLSQRSSGLIPVKPESGPCPEPQFVCGPSLDDPCQALPLGVGTSTTSCSTDQPQSKETPSAPQSVCGLAPFAKERTLPELVEVESISYSHYGPFYDLTVPGVSSYYSEGVVNHNSGKTTTGTEFITLCARRGIDTALVGRRGTEIANTHVKTILERSHPEFRPDWFASKDILVWPNGATTFCFSAEKPENIRSINIGAWWIDEAAFMEDIETVYMNLSLAARVADPKNPIHGLITSTPTPTKFMRDLEDDGEAIIRRVSTYANKANLSKDFIEMLEREYEGTRMGRQEIHGEVLRDVVGALWNEDMFQHLRTDDAEKFSQLLDTMDDIVLAIDPAGSKGPRSDATGIIGVGIQYTDSGLGRYYVLCDATLKGSPTEWAEQVFKAANHIRATRLIVEKNFGGDMVAQTLGDFGKRNESARDADGQEYRIVESRAVQSKETRAEPIVAKYEQGAVYHVTSPGIFGDLSHLEKEQVGWVPKSRGGRHPSPNRIDALVWAMREVLQAQKFAATQASSRDVMKKLKKPR